MVQVQISSFDLRAFVGHVPRMKPAVRAAIATSVDRGAIAGVAQRELLEFAHQPHSSSGRKSQTGAEHQAPS